MIDRLTGFYHWLLLAEGWQRRLVALVAGAVAALTLAPLGLLPAFGFSFPVAVWLIDGAVGGPSRWSLRPVLAAAADGWWFGFGYFLAGVWWIGAAFLVETDEFAWALPFGVLGLPAVLALFTALGFALARAVWFSGTARLFSFAFGLGLADWLRHIAFTGFPWNTFGQGMGATLVMAQGAALIGTDGLGLVALLCFAAPATVVDARIRGSAWRPTVVAGIALVALAGFGAARLALSGGFRPLPGAIETVPGVRLRLVQPNMSQREKIAQRDGLAVLSKLLQLSDRATGPQATGMADATHVIWPESPFPFLVGEDPRAIAEIARLLPATTTLVTGAVRAEGQPGRARRYFNSLIAFGPGGQVVASYDKRHLVPFGEYLPLESVLSAVGLRRFVHAPGTFATGSGAELVSLPGLPPVRPLICYEAIFPREIKAQDGRPGVFINITNDAWFGLTAGPHQHFAQARLRAIEFGVPLVRVANTGISGLVDPYGRVIATIPLGVESILDVFLPKALTSTPYSLNQIDLGSVGSGVVLAFGAVFALLQSRRNRRGQARKA